MRRRRRRGSHDCPRRIAVHTATHRECDRVCGTVHPRSRRCALDDMFAWRCSLSRRPHRRRGRRYGRSRASRARGRGRSRGPGRGPHRDGGGLGAGWPRAVRRRPDDRIGGRSGRLRRLQRLQFRQQTELDPRAAARWRPQAGQTRGHRPLPNARAAEDRRGETADCRLPSPFAERGRG